jgi:hypothetical protein
MAPEGEGEDALCAVMGRGVSNCSGEDCICHDCAHVRVKRWSVRGLYAYLPDGLYHIVPGYDTTGVGFAGLYQGREGWACCLVQPRLQQKHI